MINNNNYRKVLSCPRNHLVFILCLVASVLPVLFWNLRLLLLQVTRLFPSCLIDLICLALIGSTCSHHLVCGYSPPPSGPVPLVCPGRQHLQPGCVFLLYFAWSCLMLLSYCVYYTVCASPWPASLWLSVFVCFPPSEWVFICVLCWFPHLELCH